MALRDQSVGHNGAMIFADCGVVIAPSAAELAEIAITRGKAMCGGGGGIDEGAKDAGQDRLAAAGGSIEDEDWVRAGGAEGG